MSFPRYENYKDSGIEWLGEVPGHWEVKRLKHNLQLLTEKTDRREHPVGLENIESWSGRFVETETKFEGEGVAFKCGDILFGKLRPYLAKAYLAETTGEAVGDFHVLRPAAEIDGRFAQYQILNRDFIAIVDGSTFGAKMPRAGWDFLGNMALATPPKVEQSVISTFLDFETAQIDALIAEQQKLIALLKEKRQAVISQAVTKGLDPTVPMKDSGIEWLGKVPEHWIGPMKLISLAEKKRNSFVNGPFGSDLLANELTQEGVPVIYIRDLKQNGYLRVSEVCVTEDKAKQICFCNVMNGDVLVAKVGDPPGLAVLYPDSEPEAVVTQDVIRIRANREVILPNYLCSLLNSDIGRICIDNISVESTRTRIGLGDYKQVRLVIPSITEQISIASFLDNETAKIDELIAEAQCGIELLKERRSALISAAVTGKIDVRGWTPPEAV